MRNLRLQYSPAPQRGFTLIEVLIAVTLLAFLSIGIFQATSRSFDLNFRLGNESTEATTILLSLQSIESDLAQIYSPVLGNIPAKPDDKTEAYWSAPLRSDGFRRSRFKGEAAKVSFVANNNRRVEAGSPMSDFQKINWEVERNASNTYSLYRTTDWDVYRYEENPGKKPERVALLENLSSAKFSFYKKADKTWNDTWDSESVYAKEESRFPDLIKLRIEAPDPQNNANMLAWEIIVRPNMPLNYLDEKARATEKQKFLE
ncbi:MAG TPA: type II secretion system protein GspJ [Bdellovibrionota bacterium]|jgi:prepilin-type N-terminal cleavage/methylation domain-containing protein